LQQDVSLLLFCGRVEVFSTPLLLLPFYGENQMKTQLLVAALAGLGVAASANAAVVITNGGFETNGAATGNGSLFLADGWVAEEVATAAGIQNSTNDAGAGSGVNEGISLTQATGDQYLRLVGDVGLDGGVNQAVGSLADGESVVIGGDYFSGMFTDPVVTSYAPIVELYDGDPLGAGTLLATAVLADGALDPTAVAEADRTSTFSLSFTAAGGNGSDLYLRLRTNSTFAADNGGATVVTRGGVDNVRVVPEPGSLALLGLGGLALLRRRRA